MPRLALALLAVVLAAPASAQREGVLRLDDAADAFLVRQQALGRLGGADLGARPLAAYEARQWLDSLAADSSAMTDLDRRMLARLRGSSAGPNTGLVQRLTGAAYADGETLAAVDGPDWRLVAEPVVYLGGGPALGVADSAGGRPTNAVPFRASRGLRAAGHAGPVFFDATLLENQQAAPWVVWENRTAPRLNYVKLNDGTYDYWDVRGVVGVRSRFFEARYGRDRDRWGFGTNSLTLSGYAAPYDALQLRAQLWRLHYAAVFAELVRPVNRPSGGIPATYPRRYAAHRRLALALGRVDVELFETVVFADDSLAANRRGFQFSYLNPVLFLRAAEADAGASDNALLGAGAAWTVPAGPRLYGQVLLDELKFSELGSDWWGNKFGLLAGLRWADPGIGAFRLRNADLEIEGATLRPYLYSHRIPDNALTHYGDGLGHAAGPNARDLAVSLRWRPGPFTEVALAGSRTWRGRNTATENFGSDPRLSYETRIADYGIRTLQGIRQTETIVEGRLTQELLPSLFVEGTLSARDIRDDLDGRSRYLVVGGQLRWGLPYQRIRH